MKRAKRIFYKSLFLAGIVGLNVSLTKLEGSHWTGLAVGASCYAILEGLDEVCKHWIRKAKGVE